MIKKILVLILCGLFLFGTVACSDSGGESSGKESAGSGTTSVKEREKNYDYNINDYTEYVFSAGAITGPDSPNYDKNNLVGGTDLGFPVYDDTRDRMYFVFGDTFSGYPDNHFMSGSWRSNVVAYVDDWEHETFTTDRKFTGWITDNNGYAVSVIPGLYRSNDSRTEVTKIPTGGICIDGTLYLFYMSVRYWGAGGSWDVNYNGAVKSADGGKTWERVFDLTWVETDKGVYADQIKTLSQQTLEFAASGVDLDMSKRVNPNFMQISPSDGKDGYIYLFGSQGGRNGGMEMARVRKENFEDFESYEYFIGYDSTSNPKWAAGSAGMKQLNYDLATSKTLVIQTQVGETTVFFNPYLEKWILSDNYMNEVYIAMSKNIYGPYSRKFALLDTTYDYGTDGKSFYELYAGFSHEKLLKNDGKTMYMVISYMDRIYNSQLLEVEFA